jgi:hypothetical protein
VIVNFELVTDKLRLHARGEMRAGKNMKAKPKKKQQNRLDGGRMPRNIHKFN